MIHGFELIKDQFIYEINSRTRHWQHIKSGAEFFSVENQDEEKVFGIAFRTPPPDSSGVIHVLEHATLQGSRRYPLKSPILALVKGSLKTYINMNAYPDKTIYPVASKNLKDLYNLMDVFLDGVFYSRLNRETFKQEGWHYELESLDDRMKINGIVYNEQKGNFAMPFKRISVESQRALFPDTIYRHAYGGNPDEIPNLTYEQLKDYYKKFYHPSNARIFWYGDDDPEARLCYLDSWLKDFERTHIDSEIRLQPAFDAPRKVIVPYYAGKINADEPQGIMTLNWVLAEVGDPQLTFGFELLAQILVGTPASPLRAALMESGKGRELAGLGLWMHARQIYYSTGLLGIKDEDFSSIEGLILDTLDSLARSGLEPDLVSAAFNSVEFKLREVNDGPLPKGLVLLQDRAMTTWIHGYDPCLLLAFSAPLQEIKDRIEAGEAFFEELIRNYLIDNTHRASVLLKPEGGLSPDMIEQRHLQDLKTRLTPDERQDILEDTLALRHYHQTPESPEMQERIPGLKLGDLDRKVKVIPRQIDSVKDCCILSHPRGTNGILYLDLAFDLHSLPQDLLGYVPIFGELLIKLGSMDQYPNQRARWLGQKTGGVQSTILVSESLDGGSPAVRLVFRSKALNNRGDDLLAILEEVLLRTSFDDRRRVSQLVVESKARLEASLSPLGHQFISTRLGAGFSQGGWLSEIMTGIEQLFILRRLEGEIMSNWESVRSSFEAIRARLVNRQGLVCSLTGDAAVLNGLKTSLNNFLDTIPLVKVETTEWSPYLPGENEGLVLPSPVNFVGMGGNLYELGYKLHGSIGAITNLVNMNWLFEQIRVQGGAYGGRCTFEPRSGMLFYESYRDPHLKRSLTTYNSTSKFLRNLDLSEAERVRAICGAISRLDIHQTPDRVGYAALERYLAGESNSWRQQLRNELFDTSLGDVASFADVLEQLAEKSRVVVMGSQAAITANNQNTSHFLTPVKVL